MEESITIEKSWNNATSNNRHYIHDVLIGINTEQKAEAAHFSDTVTVSVNFPALVAGMVKLTVTDLDSGHFQFMNML
jgi:hypothetical protein